MGWEWLGSEFKLAKIRYQAGWKTNLFVLPPDFCGDKQKAELRILLQYSQKIGEEPFKKQHALAGAYFMGF